jgi:hypothetical protein
VILPLTQVGTTDRHTSVTAVGSPLGLPVFAQNSW